MDDYLYCVSFTFSLYVQYHILAIMISKYTLGIRRHKLCVCLNSFKYDKNFIQEGKLNTKLCN